ncbi:MAG: zf-HC2 domain-containing protein [Candidatus Aminicenantes bacterium RBG_16_66_30]
MNDCKPCVDRMIEAFYGELAPADKAEFERHLGACPECRAEYAALGETLKLMDRRERPDPGPEFWDGYWDKLSRRLLWEETGESRRPSVARQIGHVFSRLPRWAYQAAGAVAVLLVGILIGSRLIGPSGPAPTPTVAVAPARSGAVVQAGNFVERSKVLLLGLVNFDPATEDPYALDLDGKKAVSRSLVKEASVLRQGLNEPGQRRLRDLVTELQVIMMQIANLGSGQDVEGVELIKQGVDRGGLFLRIDLDRMARDARGDSRPGPPAGAGGPVKKSQA